MLCTIWTSRLSWWVWLFKYIEVLCWVPFICNSEFLFTVSQNTVLSKENTVVISVLLDGEGAGFFSLSFLLSSEVLQRALRSSTKSSSVLLSASWAWVILSILKGGPVHREEAGSRVIPPKSLISAVPCPGVLSCVSACAETMENWYREK